MLVFFSFSNYVCVIAIFVVQSFPILVYNKYAPFDMLEIQTVTWSFIAKGKTANHENKQQNCFIQFLNQRQNGFFNCYEFQENGKKQK